MQQPVGSPVSVIVGLGKTGLSAARHLAARGHRLGTGHDPPRLQLRAQEGDRMAAQAQADMAIVRDHIATRGQRPECYKRLIDIGDAIGMTI